MSKFSIIASLILLTGALTFTGLTESSADPISVEVVDSDQVDSEAVLLIAFQGVSSEFVGMVFPKAERLQEFYLQPVLDEESPPPRQSVILSSKSYYGNSIALLSQQNRCQRRARDGLTA